MAISSLAISLASSPKSRGRDLPSLHIRPYPGDADSEMRPPMQSR
jgi:hypothetical protein